MLSFAVAVARRGRQVPAAVGKALDDPRLAAVPFSPRRHLSWSDPTGRVRFAGWQDTGDDDPVGSRWHVDERGLTAYTGDVWPRSGVWAGHRSWAAGLADHLARRPLRDGTDDLLGVFTAVSLAPDGAGVVDTDTLGLGLTHVAEHADVTLVSSRSSIAATLLAAASGRDTPARDVLGAGWLPFAVHPLGHRTGFDGVGVLPSGASVRVDPVAGATTCERSRFWWFERPLDHDPRDLLDEVWSDVATSVRAAVAMPVPRRVLNITGGRDSRAILGVVLGEGLADAFEYRVLGADDLPDVVTARRIAATFGLDLRENAADPANVAWRRARATALRARGIDLDQREQAIRLTAGAMLGMRNVVELQVVSPPHGDRVMLNGITGELLRSNYAGIHRYRSIDDLGRFFFGYLQYGSAGILRRDAAEHYADELWRMVFHDIAEDDGPQDVIDAWFLRNRLRRWFGTGRELDEENRIYPLYSPLGARAAFEMGVAGRHGEHWHHALTRRGSPVLADLPFASGGWPGPIAGHPPRSRPRPTAPMTAPPRPALPATSPFGEGSTAPTQRTVRTEQRLAIEGGDPAILRRYLVEDAGNPVHDLVDPAAVAALLDRYDELREPVKRQLYGALTAAIWLGGHELTYRAEPPEG